MKRASRLILCVMLCLSIIAPSALLGAVAAQDEDGAPSPNYFLNFTEDSTQSQLGRMNQVTVEFADGYTTFTADGVDPYVFLPAPDGVPANNRYILIVYRTDSAAGGEIYSAKDDGIGMGEHGSTHVSWQSWEGDGAWRTKIIDISSMCESGTKFIDFRFDPLCGDCQGSSIDIKCIAGFSSLHDASAFSLDAYLESLNAPPEWNEPEYNVPEVNEGDRYDGTLSYVENDDGTVTISYIYRGERKTYTVPNDPIYTSGGFAGTDDLGRELFDANTVGVYGENGEHYVGLFYFLWMGEHGDPGVYDLTKIQHKYGAAALNANYIDPDTNKRIYGDIGQVHWMGEPLYGYYYSSDEWVMRKHVELLTNAGIDFLYIDVTNGYTYIANVMKLMKILHEYNEMGYNAPKIVFYTNTKCENVVRSLYTSIYRINKYPDTWLYVDGKPCIIANSDQITYDVLKEFFTIKEAQWPNEASKDNAWPWMDFTWPQRVFLDAEGNRSAISVSVAQHSGSVAFSDSAYYFDKFTENNRGRSYKDGQPFWQYRTALADDPGITNYGYNFQCQWDHAIAEDVPYVLVTGWNEWVAQRQDGAQHRGNKDYVLFIDTASQEFSRDIEMMRGGYFDNYYMQLVMNIQRLKGTAPVIIQDARNPINIAGGFDQWDSIKIEYSDPLGDILDRNARGFGATVYKDTSGSNDIVSSKVTNDTQNMYFYVRTADAVKKSDGESAWMQLYVNADNNAETGFYGYDYIVNYKSVRDGVTSVAKYVGDGDSFEFEEICTVNYRVVGNEMMISVPLSALGVSDYNQIYMEFKWFDADSGIRVSSMEDFYTYGDAAPLGRLNYVYQNCLAEHITNTPNNDGGGQNDGGVNEPVTQGRGCRSSIGGAYAVAIAVTVGMCFMAKRKRRR